MNLSNGTIVDGKYKILSALGEGGWGAVYKAEHVELAKPVAIKVANPEHADDPDAILRFQREAQVLANLKHKNIVSSFSMGKLANGLSYMVMEYVEGKTLAERIDEAGKFDQATTIEIALQVCDALSSSHKNGIIHRDIKPQNMIIQDDNTVKVLDFGLCRLLHTDYSLSSDLTRTGLMIGTIYYMCPELSRGLKATIHSDIYAFSCVLYECLSGRVPFLGDTPIAVLYQHQNEMPVPLHAMPDVNVSKEFELVIFKGMQKDASKRFQSADEMMQALRAVKAGRELEFDLVIVQPSQDDQKQKRNSGMVWIALATFFSVAAIVFAFLYKSSITKSVDVTSDILNHQIKKTEAAAVLLKRGIASSTDNPHESIALLKEALRRARKETGQDFFFNAYRGLGVAYENLAQYPDALAEYGNAAAVYSDLGSRDRLDAVTRLANLKSKIGQTDEALAIFEKEMAIFGAREPEEALTSSVLLPYNYMNILLIKKQYEKSYKVGLDALKTADARAIGRLDPDAINISWLLLQPAAKIGKTNEAKQQILLTKNALFKSGDEGAETGWIAIIYAIRALENNHYKEAESMYEEAKKELKNCRNEEKRHLLQLDIDNMTTRLMNSKKVLSSLKKSK